MKDCDGVSACAGLASRGEEAEWNGGGLGGMMRVRVGGMGWVAWVEGKE